MTTEMWRTAELIFHSERPYADPLLEAETTVDFLSASGTRIRRPAFWNGGDAFGVRVALTEPGDWTYQTVCSDTGNAGLHGQTGTLRCVPYQGEHAIYQKGFLTVEPGQRYFSYRDGTPFFYLGDTHWLLCHEKWEEANVSGIESQFRYTVDHRAAQGFTVYQSEPLGKPNMPVIYDLTDGLDERDIAGFQQLDRKFQYIADRGLVHAHSQLFFTDEIQHPRYTSAYLRALARFWVARYGAYPVLWTTAQEIDPHCYGTVPPERWFIVAQTVSEWDAYHHPLTAHGANNCLLTAHNSAWDDKPYHSWFGLQPQENTLNNTAYLRDFHRILKPALCYETGYEELWSDARQALGAGYKSFLGGLFGYGYGAQGVWNDDYSPDDWMRYGGYYRWFDALQFEGGKRLVHFRHFFEALDWWRLEPRFDDPAWSDIRTDEPKALATIGQDVYAAFLFDQTTAGLTLRGMKDSIYEGYWYDILTGTYLPFGPCSPVDGVYSSPQKPTSGDWILLLTTDCGWYAERPLILNSDDDRTTIAEPGEALRLQANFPVRQWWLTPAIASIQDGVLQPNGRNGLVTVYARDVRGRVASKSVILLRQEQNEPLPKPQTITVLGDGGRCSLTKEEPTLQAMAYFSPADCHNQRVCWQITEPDGSQTTKAVLEPTGAITAVSDGDILLTARSVAFPEITGTAVLHISGLGQPSLAVDAQVTSSDYYEGYDKRCYPWRAVNGITDNYSGWCSAALCSEEAPVYLYIDLRQEKVFCQIDLYTTSLAASLRDYSIQVLQKEAWKTVGEKTGNTERKNTYRFPPITARYIRVACTKGDSNGNARIDQLSVYSVWR